jgi:hypothetical protein
MRFASGIIDSERTTFRGPIQRALRLFVYHWDARGREAGSRSNPEETKMSLRETIPDAVTRGSHDQKTNASAPKRKRPLTATQEALFFGITFTLAVVLQLAVILKVANVISW